MTYHPVIQSAVNSAWDDLNQALYRANHAQLFLERCRLAPILTLADRYSCWPDLIKDCDGHTIDVDRWHFHIRLSAQRKPQVRPHLLTLLDDIGPFEKQYHVEDYGGPPLLIETWLAKFNHYYEDGQSRNWAPAYDLLAVSFYRPVTEGQRITDTCIVDTVDNSSRATRLQVVCHTDEKAVA